jgi:predicted ATPase
MLQFFSHAYQPQYMNDQEPPHFFGEWLKLRRKGLDLTQNELAQRAGCSVFALRKIEAGERRPSKQLARLLAEALEIPLAEQTTLIRVARGELSLNRLPSSSPATMRDVHETPSPPATYQLPAPPNRLIGRENELATIKRLFQEQDCRLLTVTGPGGVGKTRLAIEYARQQIADFPGGVYYVSLAPLNLPDLIIPAIADAMGLVFSGPSDLQEQLFHQIKVVGENAFLLLLDNMEHLLTMPGTAELLSDFLANLPHGKLLVTSRERLKLQGEWAYEIYGLPVPPLEFSGELEDYSAAALFLQSARRSRPDFTLSATDEEAIVQICQHVDGIPLAIELAAAWVNFLPCAEIALEVQTNLDLLSTTMRDIPLRHRSIRATFDHSWRLLTAEERQVLCQLSVFQGGFDRRAAAQITGASLPILASLVAKSLVRRTAEGRYDLHEVIRQYAQARLLDTDLEETVRDRHSEFYLLLLSECEGALKSATQQATLRALTLEMDNLRAAWSWAIAHRLLKPIDKAIRSLGWLFETTGLLSEGIDQFELLIKAIRVDPNQGWQSILGKALAQQSLLYFRRGEFSHAQHLNEEALAILRPNGEPSTMVDPLIYMGVIAHLNGELDRSWLLLDEALTCAENSGDRWGVAYARYNLGYVASLTGRYQDGYEQMSAGLEGWRKLGDPYSISLGLNYLSPTLIKLGLFDEARANLQESLLLSLETNNRWGAGTAYRFMGLISMIQGDLQAAEAHLCHSLEILTGYVIGWDIAVSTIYQGEVALLAERHEAAAARFRNALQIARDAQAGPLALEALFGLARLRFQAGNLDESAALLAFIHRHPLTMFETRERAERLLAEIREKQSGKEFLASLEKAASWTLQTLVDEFTA